MLVGRAPNRRTKAKVMSQALCMHSWVVCGWRQQYPNCMALGVFQAMTNMKVRSPQKHTLLAFAYILSFELSLFLCIPCYSHTLCVCVCVSNIYAEFAKQRQTLSENMFINRTKLKTVFMSAFEKLVNYLKTEVVVCVCVCVCETEDEVSNRCGIVRKLPV